MAQCLFRKKIVGGLVGSAILEPDAIFLASVLYLMPVQVLSVVLVNLLCQVKASSQLVSYGIDNLSGCALFGVS